MFVSCLQAEQMRPGLDTTLYTASLQVTSVLLSSAVCLCCGCVAVSAAARVPGHCHHGAVPGTRRTGPAAGPQPQLISSSSSSSSSLQRTPTPGSEQQQQQQQQHLGLHMAH
jgi:hypothetical protein